MTSYSKISRPGVETRFNTPDYRANLSIGHQEIIKILGFNINFHWQNSFVWESGFGREKFRQQRLSMLMFHTMYQRLIWYLNSEVRIF